MRVSARFSDGLLGQLDGRAIGDEFTVTAQARIVAAEEALVEIASFGDRDAQFVQGDLEVTILLSHAEVVSARVSQ